MRHKILLSTFICMWPSILLMYNINARGNDSQSTKTVYCLSNLKPLKIKTTLTKIKYKKEIKSWREKEYRYGLHEGKDRAKKGVTVGKYYLKYYKERRDG